MRRREEIQATINELTMIHQQLFSIYRRTDDTTDAAEIRRKVLTLIEHVGVRREALCWALEETRL